MLTWCGVKPKGFCNTKAIDLVDLAGTLEPKEI